MGLVSHAADLISAGGFTGRGGGVGGSPVPMLRGQAG